ncbi:MAG: guanylate kinase [Lachnospiraceae bacterium]|jgi:guanylate kinase|nr:guanylate kinase [Lachnospiraceae bacterium]MCI1327491.1 guanylate kinase [Lachnospiraceae bacterium]
MTKGVLTIVSGFAGSGKGTVMKRLLSRHEGYALSISATTRKPRNGERDGVEYFFKTKEAFEKMIEEHAFLEYASYVGNYYGTPASYVDEQLNLGKDVILEIEVQGALQVKKQRPDALLVFLTPQSGQELERRLRGRGTETDEVIRSRMKRAGEESKLMSSYDYILVNDDVDRAVEELHGLIRSQHLAASRNSGLIERISRELAVYQ